MEFNFVNQQDGISSTSKTSTTRVKSGSAQRFRSLEDIFDNDSGDNDELGTVASVIKENDWVVIPRSTTSRKVNNRDDLHKVTPVCDQQKESQLSRPASDESMCSATKFEENRIKVALKGTQQNEDSTSNRQSIRTLNDHVQHQERLGKGVASAASDEQNKLVVSKTSVCDDKTGSTTPDLEDLIGDYEVVPALVNSATSETVSHQSLTDVVIMLQDNGLSYRQESEEEPMSCEEYDNNDEDDLIELYAPSRENASVFADESPDLYGPDLRYISRINQESDVAASDTNAQNAMGIHPAVAVVTKALTACDDPNYSSEEEDSQTSKDVHNLDNQETSRRNSGVITSETMTPPGSTLKCGEDEDIQIKADMAPTLKSRTHDGSLSNNLSTELSIMAGNSLILSNNESSNTYEVSDMDPQMCASDKSHKTLEFKESEELSILAGTSLTASGHESFDYHAGSDTMDSFMTSGADKKSPLSTNVPEEQDSVNCSEISILAGDRSFLSANESDIIFSTPQHASSPLHSYNNNTYSDEVNSCAIDTISVQNDADIYSVNDEAEDDKNEDSANQNARNNSVEEEDDEDDETDETDDSSDDDGNDDDAEAKKKEVSSSAMLSSGFYDNTEVDTDYSQRNPLRDLSPPVEYMLTIDDAECFLRSCATASTCSSDDEGECSKEIADICGNSSLSSYDSDESDDDSSSQTDDDDDEYPHRAKDNDDDDKPLSDAACLHTNQKDNATGKRGGGKIHPPPKPALSNVRERIRPNPTSHKNDRVYNSNRQNHVHQQSTRVIDPRANFERQHFNKPTCISAGKFDPHNALPSNRGNSLRNSRINRKLFDPYLEQRLSWRSSMSTKRPWRPNLPPKCVDEEWPTLPDKSSPEQPVTEARGGQRSPSSYANVLVNSPKKPAPPSIKKKKKPIMKLMDIKFDFASSSADTCPPGSSELLISNSRDSISINTDGKIMSTNDAPKVTSSKSACLDNSGTGKINKAASQNEFRDPAIVAMSTGVRKCPPVSPPTNHHANGSNGAQTMTSDLGPCNLFSACSATRPAIQHDDPAIVGVFQTVVNPHTTTVVNQSKPAMPRSTFSPNSFVKSHQNVMFEDPAIVFADRKVPRSCQTSGQTGFWSEQDHTRRVSVGSGYIPINSSPFSRHRAITSTTYSGAGSKMCCMDPGMHRYHHDVITADLLPSSIYYSKVAGCAFS